MLKVRGISFNKSLLLLISCFFIINTNIVGNFSYLDVFLIIYVIKHVISVKHFSLKRRTVKIITVLNIFLLLAFAFVPFANQKTESFLYLFQMVLAFNFIPIFLDIIQKQQLFDYFLKTVFKMIIIVGVLYITYAILHFSYGKGKWLFFTLRGNHRMVWGDGFVANDLAQYLVLAFLLSESFISKRSNVLRVNLLLSIVFLLTLSKTVLLVIILYFLFRFTKKTILFGLFLVFIVLLLNINFISDVNSDTKNTRVSRLFKLNADGSADKGRLKVYIEVIRTLPSFITTPLYGQRENVKFKTNSKKSPHFMSSVHNIILSILVNFGLIPLLFIVSVFFIVFFYLISKGSFYNLSTVLTFLFLLMVILFLNAFMLSRSLIMPSFIIIYMLKSNNIKYDNKYIIENK